jgi:hypothetical protein
MALEIRSLYRIDPINAEAPLEQYLCAVSRDLALPERLALLDRVIADIDPATARPGSQRDAETVTRFFSILLGRTITPTELASPEFHEKLAQSLGIIFDSLNQIIGIIHTTLLGESGELETIRHLLGSNIECTESAASLRRRLDTIQQGFLISHKAFQHAIQVKMEQILTELDPRTIEAAAERGIRFGPFRKADLFQNYEDRYSALKEWVQSGRCREEVLREFEKICRKQFSG